MKKLVLGLAIALGGLTLQSAVAAMPAFSTSDMGQHTLDSLDFADIIHELYKEPTSEPYVIDERITAMPHTQLGYGEKGEQIVAMMHPVITYENTAGERRYLVMIERVKVSAVNHKLMACHVCAGTADLFTFKRLDNGDYQLVSRGADDLKVPGSWGRVNLNTEEIKGSIQPLGRDIVGSVYESGYLSTGIYEGVWNALHLSEDDYIRFYTFGDAGGDSSGYFGDDSPKSYTYTATYEVLPNNSKYYPIKVTYSGTKENWDKGGRVEPINDSEILRFNEQTGNYE